VDCNECVDKLYPFLDRELNADERRQVEVHLSLCPPCRDHFRFEYNVLTLVCQRCRETAAPPELVAKVRKLCQQQTSST